MKTFVSHVVIEENSFENGRRAYSAYVPELKSLHAASCGYTGEAALKNAQEPTGLVIASMISRGEPLPKGVETSEEPLVAVRV